MGAPNLWLMAASMAFSAVQSMNKGDQEQDFHRFQADQAEADATAEREAGEVRASKVRRAGKSAQSEAVAALAASGVEVTAGTPVKIQTQIARNAEEDALNEILYGDRKGRRLDQNAAMERAAGSRAASAGYMGAVSSVLAGGAKMAGDGWKTAAKPMDWGRTGDFSDGTVRIA